MKKTEKDWRRIVQLAHYTRLASTDNPQQVSAELESFKKILQQEHGLSEEDLQAELNQFKKEVLPKREAIVKKKATEIMSDIVKGLKKIKSGECLSTDDNREIYHRMQEILAMDPYIASKALQEEEEKANVTHRIFCSINLLGNDLGGHTYYFSFDK